jgi:hypothetical protein
VRVCPALPVQGPLGFAHRALPDRRDARMPRRARVACSARYISNLLEKEALVLNMGNGGERERRSEHQVSYLSSYN